VLRGGPSPRNTASLCHAITQQNMVNGVNMDDHIHNGYV